ncbi:MAG: FAD-binding oxidoreductase [Bacteroidetes bacterium HGW-Bacteroidetes-2]|jgi:FAD/FMN-containing dehydrogenase/Fe-S oxidoreductase|nr:MAG: FAD-binding oxidoreductase [Bacteroidetes bacterium HGW-Bacteroidetes-2]
MKTPNHKALNKLAASLDGEILVDELSKALYATDASVYRILPDAIALPKTIADLQKLIAFATTNKTSLIPRTAGTSLAGQCVGKEIVVDVSKYFTRILQIDEKEKTVIIEPGVIRDVLNLQLKKLGLFFGPNTSTSNRCMLGGMVGNNSSGTTSITYGVTRDKVLEMETILSDGSLVTFKEVSFDEFLKKTKENSLEGNIYHTIYNQLKDKIVQKRIRDNFPNPKIHRRNTGYAIDELIKSEVFSKNGSPFNMCKLLTGSEGTLAFTTKIKLQLDILPPSETILIAAHFRSIENCLKSVVPAMSHTLFTCEMMDKVILDCTKENLKYKESRFFIEGDPEAILLLELKANTQEEVFQMSKNLIAHLKETNLAYALPILLGNDIEKALELRKAGLGLLGNIHGDKKAVACIEDTAVALEDLSNYISEFTKLMQSFNQKAVYYAHAGAGELHLRPILNLKDKKDVALFKQITNAVAHLVKKYKGSLSGEHGDGIVRSSFLPLMIGEANFQIIREIKCVFDPNTIFNPGKIVAPLPIDKNLRYKTNQKEPLIETLLDFSDSLGILRSAEKCNGSGDCRKPESAGGSMCPSYRVTNNEKDTTRGRANALREFLTQSEKANKFNHKELKEVFELCISCKGCKSECPSNVDMASLKAEFEFQFKKANGSSFRTKLFAKNHQYNLLGSKMKKLTNFVFSNPFTSLILKKIIGIAPKRSLPLLSTFKFNKELQSIKKQNNTYKSKIYFFLDEFTELLDTEIGIDALHLLSQLGYDVQITEHFQSGRAFISKGFLEEAKVVANKNIAIFKELISEDVPLIGLEPSAILTFRDEYIRLAKDKEAAKKLATNTFTIEEFLAKEIAKGNITANSFSEEEKTIKLHVHCHQKALSSVTATFQVVNLPKNYKVTVIPSGCCGMAGSFGYEKEHYYISMKMGELTLFPSIRKTPLDTILAATGTSCRHQIKDGTDRIALHPITILRNALKYP